ncbi:hypothetical protein IMY05_003G0074600 [Salix suchowensis]|nr:hypothetical protein IMY05_003G0074600 [Salix suchowensis]
MASRRFLCLWNVFLIAILLLSSATGSRDLSKIAEPRMILEKAINPQNGPPWEGNYKAAPSNG